MADQVIKLAREVISREPKRRPETEWIQQKANRLAERERIYFRSPSETDMVKIRFWRTGRHLPSGREEVLAFAKALQLDRQETIYLLQACAEKSDLVFGETPSSGDAHAFVYQERTALMEMMISEYIAQILPTRLLQLDIPYDRLAMYARHLYCIDALSTTHFAESSRKSGIVENHLSSGNYESEFLRTRRLLGEIPRRTMLRQIFLLGMPYLNRRLVDERLECLGYLPLTEGHTSQQGALVDDLVIGILKLYENSCMGQEPLVCRQWLLERLSILDRFLLKEGKEDYRFLYFRSLSTMAGYGE